MKTPFCLAIAALAIGVSAETVCGKTGYDDTQDPYYTSSTTGEGSYAICSKLCQDAGSNCQSFAFNRDACMLFNNPLDASTFTYDDTSSDIYYDRSCLPKPKDDPPSPTTTQSPSGCPSVEQSLVLQQLVWINTTHNCDCAASRPDVGNGTGCLNNTGQWCEPGSDKTCTDCGVGVCMTGLPSQPVGYGPPDYVKLNISGGVCEQRNPQSFKPRQVGAESLYCGGGQYPIITFIGNSNKDDTSGYVSYVTRLPCGTASSGETIYWAAVYNSTFPIACKHDSSFNATCALTQPSVKLPLIGYSRVY